MLADAHATGKRPPLTGRPRPPNMARSPALRALRSPSREEPLSVLTTRPIAGTDDSPSPSVQAASVAAAGAAAPASEGRALLELTKPGLTGLVVATSSLGYLLAHPHPIDWMRLVSVTFGTALVGGGANALNQWAEAHLDA